MFFGFISRHTWRTTPVCSTAECRLSSSSGRCPCPCPVGFRRSRMKRWALADQLGVSTGGTPSCLDDFRENPNLKWMVLRVPPFMETNKWIWVAQKRTGVRLRNQPLLGLKRIMDIWLNWRRNYHMKWKRILNRVETPTWRCLFWLSMICNTKTCILPNLLQHAWL